MIGKTSRGIKQSAKRKRTNKRVFSYSMGSRISFEIHSYWEGGCMQRWEYMIRKTDLKALNQPSMLDLEQVRLTEYGEEGWEIVSAIPSQECLIIFLKRAVEGQ